MPSLTNAPPKRDLAVYQYLPLYQHPRLQDSHLREFRSFEPRKPPPPLTKAMDDFLQCLDSITSNTMIALCGLFYMMREIRPPMSWAWVDSSYFPDLCIISRLQETYLHLLAAMDTVHFACAKYFLALRDGSSSSRAVQEFRTACKRVVEHIVRVKKHWDEAAADLSEYLPLHPLERLEQLLLSGMYPSCDHHPAERNKVLSLLPSLHRSAKSQADVLEDLYRELEKNILCIDADSRCTAELPHTALNVALAALIWQEWGLAQYRGDLHLARVWDWDAKPSNYHTTHLINESQQRDET
ncbi:hypothetical protein FB45DRAFT_1066076 [Roridomyces roridus]|uniref:Uncharacterized protein n=1 Tax=Roridomyces roridus TaxID=1738132 RepID=A0AAD7B601_9AGAR|nr:hypothetical protein FB45DRAFT_1066076 [Roridomyces roridus]